MPSPPRPGFWSQIHVYPEHLVTTHDAAAERPPEEGGLTHDDVESIWHSVVKLYNSGLHPAIALCLRRHGRVVIDRSIGHLRGNAPGDSPDTERVLATPHSLFNLYSAAKAVTAMVVHLLDERGLIHLDNSVAEYLPEFGKHGKEWITLRHILTHRAGIPAVPGTHVDLDLVADPKRVYELLCETTPVSIPGRRLAYHALTGGFVIGELVERVTGRTLRDYLRTEIAEPLGMKHFSYGATAKDIPLVAENAYTGPPAPPPYSWLLKRSLGVSIREAVELSNDPRFLTAIIPSGNLVATANEVSRFFQLLLDGGELDGVRIFDRKTVRRAIAEQNFLEIDSILALPVRYGMGFMLGSRIFSLYGHNTPRAFGHIGFTNVVGYADPDRDISVALMTSGKPFITPGQLTWLNVARTIARRCLR